MMPEIPEIPTFPTLQWTSCDGRYCISEEDADRLLDYGENALPKFKFQLGQYERQAELILAALAEP